MTTSVTIVTLDLHHIHHIKFIIVIEVVVLPFAGGSTCDGGKEWGTLLKIFLFSIFIRTRGVILIDIGLINIRVIGEFHCLWMFSFDCSMEFYFERSEKIMETIIECHFFDGDLLFETVNSRYIFFDTTKSILGNCFQLLSEGWGSNSGLSIFCTELSFEFVPCNWASILSL